MLDILSIYERKCREIPTIMQEEQSDFESRRITKQEIDEIKAYFKEQTEKYEKENETFISEERKRVRRKQYDIKSR